MEYTYKRKENSAPRGSDEVSLSLLARVRPYAALPNVVLSGADLSDRLLNNISFDGAHLSRAIFDNSDLTGTNFEGADLTNASFRGSNLRNASFKDAVLEMCDFTGAVLDFAILEGANIEGANFTDITSTYIYADDKTATYRFRSGPLFIQLIKSTEPPPPITREPGSLRLRNPGAVRKAAGMSPTAQRLISQGIKRSIDKHKAKTTYLYEEPPATDIALEPGDIPIAQAVVVGEASERAANPGGMYMSDIIPMVQTRITNPSRPRRISYSIDDSAPGVLITRSHNGPGAGPISYGGTKETIEGIISRAGFRMPAGDLESLFERSIDSGKLRAGKKAALERYIANLNRQLEIEKRSGVSERDAARQIARQCLIALEATVN